MIFYISGPMTKYKHNDYNRAAFHAAEDYLTKQGHIVLNPARNVEGLTFDQYMKIDLAMVEVAEAIYMLREWEDSTGAKIELKHAIENGKVIFFQEVEE